MSNYTIAKYIRLSVEDGVSESMSIPHQRLILDRHIDELDIPNAEVLEFVDNGHSGVNMERPAMQELLELVRSGRINAICVKDFSRFSRSAMDSGYFIEQVFPLYRVRFIAVNDRFDSEDYKDGATGGIDVAFKFLMHEYYSKDLSLKVSSAKRVRIIRGESIPKNAIYGYYKSDKGVWEPEEPAASVIREIYKMALGGLPATKIRDALFKAGYPTPGEFIRAKQGHDIDPRCLWRTQSINKILTNEQYAGTYIAGKLKSLEVGSAVRVPKDKSEWTIIPNHHTPVVTKELFDEVQRVLQSFLKGRTTETTPNKSWRDNALGVRRRKMINGTLPVRKVMYGYRKMPDGTLEIDEVAAGVIREMYEYARQGLRFEEIRDKLTAAEYTIPYVHNELSRGVDIEPSCQWTTVSVRAILANEQYTGAYISGRQVKDFDTGKIVLVPKHDWIVIPDLRPAIVSRELYDEVQAVIAANRYKPRNQGGRNHLLKKKVFCGCCGQALFYDPAKIPLYHCYFTAANPDAECHKMKIEAHKLDEAILTVIRKQAEAVLGVAELSALGKVKTEASHITECERQIRKYENERQKCYERFVLREIDRDTYQAEKADYTTQIGRLTNQLVVLRQHETDKLSLKKSAAIAKDVLSEAITPREIVDLLVKKVKLFPGNNLEIEWKVADFTLQG